MKEHSITFVVGPTGAGKSAWALDAAVKNNGIIVNADSVQFFRFLDIGSAKPSRDERSIVPHFLYDIVNPDQSFTAGDFYRQALKIIEDMIDSHNIYVVGGSGFYLQALEKGMYDVPDIPIEIQMRVGDFAKSNQLYSELVKSDAEIAQKIGPTDTYRLQRALSVVLTTGKTMAQIESDFLKKNNKLSDRFNLRKVGITVPRDILRERIEKRTAMMFRQGFLAEVQKLIDAGYRESKALTSVGYRECVMFLEQKLTEQELQPLIVKSTMQLAKRQSTWFKRDQSIEWLAPRE